MADWSSIPHELLCVIANKLTTIEDYASFAAVCQSYKSATKEDKWRPEKVSQPPWLLLCCLDAEECCGKNTLTTTTTTATATAGRGLLSLYKNTKRFLMNLPELHARHCWGTPYGWIVTLGLDKKLHLFNPLTHRRIPLPDPDPVSIEGRDADNFRGFYIHRAILIKRPSSSSGSEDLLVVTVCPLGDLRVMRPHTWEDVKPLGYVITDFICYKGQFYAMCHRAMLLICYNIDGPDHPSAEEFVPLHTQFPGYNTEKYYVVESLGELLMVVRYLEMRDGDDNNSTYKFEVYKLDFETRKWIEIHDLGDCALFVGDCQTLSLPKPNDFNCRPNCIYFMDDDYEQFQSKGGRDMGVYDFKEHLIKALYEGVDSRSFYSTPTWFIPSFT